MDGSKVHSLRENVWLTKHFHLSQYIGRLRDTTCSDVRTSSVTSAACISSLSSANLHLEAHFYILLRSNLGGFSPVHAPLVRPVDGAYQIVHGHHRVNAAFRADLAAIPCWVQEMDDEEAFMQLVLGNTQGELSPLEIGIHVYKAVGKGTAGRGNRGGLSAYAERLGRSKQYITQLYNAGEVAKSTTQVVDLEFKAKHLAAVHSAPRQLWSLLVEKMLDKEWSVAETEEWVTKVREFEIDPKWEHIFLPLQDVVVSPAPEAPVSVSERPRAARRGNSRVSGCVHVYGRLSGQYAPFGVRPVEELRGYHSVLLRDSVRQLGGHCPPVVAVGF